MIEDGRLAGAVEARYPAWVQPENQAMLVGKESLDAIALRVHRSGLEPLPRSGRQEYLESLLNTYF